MAPTPNDPEESGVLRPRALRAFDHHIERPHLAMDRTPSSLSSGRSTPVPEDAPPSAHYISTVRKQVRAQVKQRIFYNIDYQPRLSHFDPNSDHRDFHGFFILFWISLVIMVITTVLRNIKDTGYPLRVHVWSLLSANVFQLALADMGMVASTAIIVPLHRAIRSSKGLLRWGIGGMVVQSIYQTVWLSFWVILPFKLDWTWTAQVFLTLHTLTILMKMHSYAFYNGHLSETERRLSALDEPQAKVFPAAVHYPRSPVVADTSNPANSEIDSSDTDTDPKQQVSKLRADLAMELTSPLGHVTYPQNLTWRNYVEFIFFPTLCYELEYPRTKDTCWIEVFIKAAAVFGCIFLLTLTSEEFIVPVLSDSAFRLRATPSHFERGLILAETISMLLFPFMVTFLLVFLVIFEYVLGAFAEITRFADRRFYSDWWNSCDWLEFSRKWNLPVHHFLRRHVYFSSLTRFSAPGAMAITFLVSSIAHELVMVCITKKWRGYGFFAMMLQLPIVAIQRSKFVKGRKTFNVRTFVFGYL
ncbi:Sterol O-acyltransferase 2 (Sterol-ester synthase 2) [Microsporum canis]